MKKIGLILVLIIILPIAFLLVNEFGKLSDNEQVLEQIYNNQLQAILFSVNQYSEDVVRTTANSIITNIESSPDRIAEDKNFDLLLNESRKFTILFVTDSINSITSDSTSGKMKFFPILIRLINITRMCL